MTKIICYCKNISEETIKEAISKGAKTLKDIQKLTSACTGNNCKERNPLSKCCSIEINLMLGNNTSNESSLCCCCI